MNQKPIGPTAHGVIDYGFVATLLLAPTLFGLKGAARTICYFFAAMTGLTNALTEHGVGIKPLISLRAHGKIETPYVPILLLLPWAAGTFKQRNALRFFVGFFVTALTNHLLTDYNAEYEAE
jgi:hypothetical protein